MNTEENPYKTLSEDLRTSIEKVSISKDYEVNDLIMKPGSYISSAVIILSGTVKVFRMDNDGNAHFLYFLSQGELCVLSTLCCLRMRQSDMRAVAFTSCEVLFIPSPYPEKWMLQYPEWNHYVLQSFNKRMGELLDTFDSVVFNHLDERLLFYLKQHYMAGGNRLSFSHQQIADELNSSREVITRLLKKLEEAGFVKVNRSCLDLLPKISI